MGEISSTQNLQAHYSSVSKVERPKNTVVAAPVNLPSQHLFNDVDANKRMQAINNDIYVASQREKSRDGKNFLKYFGAGLIAILAFLGLKRVCKK